MSKLFFFLLLIAILFSATAIFIVGIYQLGWRDSYTRAFANLVPLPAALVNGNFILVDQVFETGNLDALIEDQMIAQEAGKRGIKERDGELARQMLLIKLNQENTVNAAYKKIETALARLDKGDDFRQVSREFSEHEESKYIGGDLGFLLKEDLPPYLAPQIFSLELNKHSDIIVSPDGYHIFKLTARDEKTGEFQVRHILVRGIDLEEYLESVRGNYGVYVFGRLK